MASLPERIETERLVLRPFEDADVPRLVALIGDWEVARSLARVPHPYAEADARWWLARTAEARGAGSALHLAAAGRENGRLVGGIGLDVPGGELGYWLGREHWGQGYATEMATALVRVAFAELGLPEVHASTAPWNEASGRVLTKAGLLPRGTRDLATPMRGLWRDAPIYGIGRAEWLARHG